MSDVFESLSAELTEKILRQLPIPDLVRASLTCRLFRGLILSPGFPWRPCPWFFFCGLHNISSKYHRSYGFDPSSFSWFRFPSPPVRLDDLSATQGFYFVTTSSSSFSLSPILRPHWISLPPLFSPRSNALISVFSNSCIIVVGGARFTGRLVDLGERLDAEIYDPETGSWCVFPRLPIDLPRGYSAQTLTSVIFRNKFFVLGIYSLVITWFDLGLKCWGPVQQLRIPIACFSFLIACHDTLVVAGMCQGPYRVIIWSINDESMEVREISVMPMDFLEDLVDVPGDEEKFASVKCVGLGNLVYVFNQNHYNGFSTCVFNIDTGQWMKLPPLPTSVSKFHKIITSCSDVSHRDIFRVEDEPN